MPIEKIEGAELLHTDNGNLKVRIVASTIERFQNKQPQLIFSNGLEVIFYKDTIVQSILEAENAWTVYMENSTIFIGDESQLIMYSLNEITDEFTYTVTGEDGWMFDVTSEGILQLYGDVYAVFEA